MTTIILHGYLRELHPHDIKVEADSAAEALHSLALIPALKPTNGRHHVRVENYDSADAIYERRKVDVLHVYPVMAGAGKNGVGQIILGIVIIAIAWWNPAGWSVGGTLIMSQGGMYLAGAMMILGGVMQMLSPQPSLTASNEDKSRYLGNGRNTTTIGTRIPMIYGRRKAYGQYISFDIDSTQFNSAPSAWYSSTFTDYGDLTHSAAPVGDQPISDPQHQYKSPVSRFAGLTYPAAMTTDYITYVNFNAVELTPGDWDINFSTGQTLHVRIANGGMVSQGVLLGGEITQLPSTGTPIAFTQNYG